MFCTYLCLVLLCILYFLFWVYPALVELRVFLTYVYFNTVTVWWCKFSL